MYLQVISKIDTNILKKNEDDLHIVKDNLSFLVDCLQSNDLEIKVYIYIKKRNYYISLFTFYFIY